MAAVGIKHGGLGEAARRGRKVDRWDVGCDARRRCDGGGLAGSALSAEMKRGRGREIGRDLWLERVRECGFM